jgi:hypothetical protein
MISETTSSTQQDSSVILMVARGNAFSNQLIEQALKMARGSQSILVALNILSDDRFSPGVEGQRARRNSRADCHWNILAARKAAVLLKIRLDHLILFGSFTGCIEKVQSKYPCFRCMLAEPAEGEMKIRTPVGDALPQHKAIVS